MGYNSENARRIVLDIETVGDPGVADLLDPVSAPANYKDPQKIADYIAEASKKQIENAGLEADLCEIVAIGLLIEGRDGEPIVMTRGDRTEGKLIHAAWKAIETRSVIGFNSLSFDLPVLIRRSQLLGIPVPDVNLDRYRSPHIDLKQRLSFNGVITWRSLKFYARRFGIPCHDQTDGAQIAALVAAGNWQAVADHCRSDVKLTAQLAARLGYFQVPQVPEESQVA